jgi:membrane protease YdiL (CAAX protease family)
MSPIIIASTITLALIALRALDLLVLQANSWPDPSILSKGLGLLLVFLFLRTVRERIGSIGLHTRNLGYAIGIGAVSLLAMFACLYAIEFYTLRAAGEDPRVVIGIVDKSGVLIAGTMFVSMYFAGQVLNAFAEESIFRGIILPRFMRTMSFWKANLAQALLFAVAHLIWPLSSFALGQATLSEALIQAAMLLVFTTMGGLLFGYLYYRTNSLWTSVLAHFIDNSVWLFVHVETSTRINAETDVSMFARLGFLSLALIAWFVTKRARLTPLAPRV